MLRFAFRHLTAIVVVGVIAAWAIFYLPNTPAWSVFWMKHAIDAHNGEGAAQYVDFPAVVKSAGYQMVKNRAASDPLTAMFGSAAVEALSGPMAQLTRAWAVGQVNDGRKELQMPAVAVLGAVVLMHRDGNTAFTKWTDPKGQTYEVHMTRGDDGIWRVSEVENVDQLLQKLKEHEQKQFQTP
jgi:uncharacterized iron-regulated membrane protein